ncbi:MAG: hypothetical protein KGL26_11120, partial [Pseudomonadota bacterium]|nr:hypothetical protein [Pseudomonadota bacterium]
MKGSVAGLAALLLAASALSCAAKAGEANKPILGKESHGQTIVERALAAHSNLVATTIYARVPSSTKFPPPPAKGAPVAVASNRVAPGSAAPAAIRAVVKTGEDHFATQNGHLIADLVLNDMSGKPAGAVALDLHGESKAALTEEARAITGEMSRWISYSANMMQAEHMDRNVPLKSYAQHLIDRALKLHPDVMIMAIHAATPKNADPEILASNIGRIGKKADDDDMRVVAKGATNLEVNKDLVRYEVELPLNDVSGVRIGALGVVFGLTPGMDQNAKHREAIAIRNEISRRILKPANLVEAWPYDPHFSDDTYAQA